MFKTEAYTLLFQCWLLDNLKKTVLNLENPFKIPFNPQEAQTSC